METMSLRSCDLWRLRSWEYSPIIISGCRHNDSNQPPVYCQEAERTTQYLYFLLNKGSLQKKRQKKVDICQPSPLFRKSWRTIFLVFSETRPYLGDFWEILFFSPLEVKNTSKNCRVGGTSPPPKKRLHLVSK